jgi:hypothetical protein
MEEPASQNMFLHILKRSRSANATKYWEKLSDDARETGRRGWLIATHKPTRQVISLEIQILGDSGDAANSSARRESHIVQLTRTMRRGGSIRQGHCWNPLGNKPRAHWQNHCRGYTLSRFQPMRQPTKRGPPNLACPAGSRPLSRQCAPGTPGASRERGACPQAKDHA